jgi:subtilisin family serine protease
MNFAGTGWSATGWDGTGWSATGWDGTGWSATGWDGSAWGSGAWNGSIWNSTFLLSRASGQNGDPLTKYEWGWETVNAKQALAKANTPSRAICIVDSGVDYTHPDLAGQMWRDPVTGGYGWDFYNNDSDPMDDAGHGTHVAGIAAAGNRNGYGMASVSGAKIMAVKVLAANGTGTELDLALGIQYCVDKGAKIISMSLSTDQDSPAVRSAVQYANAHGVIMVAAAGNTGTTGGMRYPAAYPEVIAVAAVMPDGRWAPYSTTGSWVDVAAPGFAIVSTYKGGGYRAINGTSMATPFVSATVALLLQVNASFTPSDVKAILGRSAIDLGPPGPDPYVGFGFVRADLAVKMSYSR